MSKEDKFELYKAYLLKEREQRKRRKSKAGTPARRRKT